MPGGGRPALRVAVLHPGQPELRIGGRVAHLMQLLRQERSIVINRDVQRQAWRCEIERVGRAARLREAAGNARLVAA